MDKLCLSEKTDVQAQYFLSGASENAPVSSQLQLAYIFACDGGKKASQWEEHLAPAQVITYNRASTVWTTHVGSP